MFTHVVMYIYIFLFCADNRACFAEDDFRCTTTGACIHKRQVCDGRQHCSDNSDEENCCKPQLRCKEIIKIAR